MAAPPMIRKVTDADALSKIEACAKRVRSLEAQHEAAKEAAKSIKQDLDDALAELVTLGAEHGMPLLGESDEDDDE